jgi:shikimate kinase
MDALKENGIIIFINRPVEDIVSDVDVLNRPLLKKGSGQICRLYEDRIGLYKEYCNVEIVNDGKIEDTVEDIVKILDFSGGKPCTTHHVTVL